MDFIYSYLQGILAPFSAEDQDFIKAYWDSTFKILLNLYQKVLEVRVDRNVQTVMENHKEFYHGYNFHEEYEQFEVESPSLPYTLDHGAWNVQCYTAPYTIEETVDLPAELPDDAYGLEVLSAKGGYTVDGNVIRGTGSIPVKYWRTETTNFSISGRTLTSSEAITSIKGRKTALDPINIISTCHLLEGNLLWDPDKNFSGVAVGASITVGSVVRTVAEVIDPHTIRPSSPIGAPGEELPYTLVAYPYVYSVEGFPVLKGINYTVENDQIGFVERPTDTVEAREVLFENTNPFADLMDGPDDLDSFKALWAAVFLGAQSKYIEMALGALMGIPYVNPVVGTCRVSENEYSYSWIREPIEITFEANDEVSVESEYFQGNDTAIRLSDGRFVKITKVLTRTTARVEGIYTVGEVIDGQVADWSFDNIILEDDFGTFHPISVPDGTCPLYAPLTIVEKFTRLTSGIRIFDKTDRTNYVDFVDETRFAVTPGYDVDKARNLLTGNTFVIETDLDGVNLDYINQMIPAWTQYILREKPRMRSVVTWDAISVIDTAYQILLGKIAGLVPITPISAPSAEKRYEVVGAVESDFRAKGIITGTYLQDATGYYVSNLKDGDGNSMVGIDIKFIVNYDNAPTAPRILDRTLYEESDVIATTWDPTIPGIRLAGPMTGWTLSGGVAGYWVQPTSFEVILNQPVLHRSGYLGSMVIDRVNSSKNIGYCSVPELGSLATEYVPGIFASSEMILGDSLRLEYTDPMNIDNTLMVSPATGILLDFDYQRDGAKLLGNVLLDGSNSGNLYTINSFTDDGEAEIIEISPSSAPSSDSSAAVGIYAFVLRHNDGAISTFGE